MAAEGHRKYVESLQHKLSGALEKVRRPDVDFVEGLSPVLVIGQAYAGSTGPRSTKVASATEIADYARLLWATVGIPHCPLDGARVSKRSLDDCVAEVAKSGDGYRIILLALSLPLKHQFYAKNSNLLKDGGFNVFELITRLRDLMIMIYCLRRVQAVNLRWRW